MRHIDGVENLGGRLPFPVVTVGTFDGVHVGHQRVLHEVVSWAKAESGTAVVITFEQPPRSVLIGGSPSLVTSMPHRLVLFERLGVDVCVVLQFTRRLAATDVGDFVRTVFVEGVGARGVVMGHGAAFGRNREGDEAFLRERAAGFAFDVRSVPAVLVDGEPVSSTRVRQAVMAGDFDLATRLLGRPFSVYGTVVRGAGRGRNLGFATANLDLQQEVVPPDGVYVATAAIDDRRLPAVVSVGSSPTFTSSSRNGTSGSVVEVHVLDFDREIYGADVEVEFVERIRAQKRFGDVDELVGQMMRDVEHAREYFRSR